MVDDEVAWTRAWYERFAEHEARGQSAMYEEWALGVASDERMLQLLTTLPRPKRQPNLLFACSRLAGAPLGAYADWSAWVSSTWAGVHPEMLARSTQTNEPRRAGVLLAALAGIPGPIALVEVGASAGLCLYPDRYSWVLSDGRRLDPIGGPSALELAVDVEGEVPFPDTMPQVVERVGIDLNPLDVRSPDDRAWLETLIWPEQEERRVRLRTAIDLVRVDPPRILTGDAVDGLEGAVAAVGSGATVVVVAMGVLAYLDPPRRSALLAETRRLGARTVTNEGLAVLPEVRERLPGPPPDAGRFVLALDGHPLAWTGPHGQSIAWLRPPIP